MDAYCLKLGCSPALLPSTPSSWRQMYTAIHVQREISKKHVLGEGVWEAHGRFRWSLRNHPFLIKVFCFVS